jgi:predicted deacylase
MKDPIAARLAYLQSPQIIVHNSVSANTLEGAAMKVGIKSIALQVGNPLVFQPKFVSHALTGVKKIMSFLKMIPEPQEPTITKLPIICSSSTWLNTSKGGLITIYPEINTWVKKGELIAKVKDLFGTVVEEFLSPDDCIVVGKNSNPLTQSGTPFIILGFCHKNFEDH